MSITIYRKTGWMGSGSKIDIKMNGEKIGRIEENQEVVVNLSERNGTIKVTQWGIKSNELEVQDGDRVKIKPTPFYIASMPLILLLNFMNIFIHDFEYKTVVFLMILFFIVFSMYYFNMFNLELVEDK